MYYSRTIAKLASVVLLTVCGCQPNTNTKVGDKSVDNIVGRESNISTAMAKSKETIENDKFLTLKRFGDCKISDAKGQIIGFDLLENNLDLNDNDFVTLVSGFRTTLKVLKFDIDGLTYSLEVLSQIPNLKKVVIRGATEQEKEKISLGLENPNIFSFVGNEQEDAGEATRVLTDER